jgi:hypothetical protein
LDQLQDEHEDKSHTATLNLMQMTVISFDVILCG